MMYLNQEVRKLLWRRYQQFYLGTVSLSPNNTPRLSIQLMLPRFLETFPLSGPEEGGDEN